MEVAVVVAAAVDIVAAPNSQDDSVASVVDTIGLDNRGFESEPVVVADVVVVVVVYSCKVLGLCQSKFGQMASHMKEQGIGHTTGQHEEQMQAQTSVHTLVAVILMLHVLVLVPVPVHIRIQLFANVSWLEQWAVVLLLVLVLEHMEQ